MLETRFSVTLLSYLYEEFVVREGSRTLHSTLAAYNSYETGGHEEITTFHGIVDRKQNFQVTYPGRHPLGPDMYFAE